MRTNSKKEKWKIRKRDEIKMHINVNKQTYIQRNHPGNQSSIFQEIKFLYNRVLERKIRNKEQGGLSTKYFKIDRYVCGQKKIYKVFSMVE